MLGFLDYVRIYRARGIGRLCDELKENWLFDKLHGTDTQERKVLADYDIDSLKLLDSVQYQPAYTSIIRRSLKLARDLLDRPSSFVDFGSGKGKVLIEASKLDFTRVIGVEIDGVLNEVAQKNIDSFRASAADPNLIELVNLEATHFEIPEDIGVICFFNPFGKRTLEPIVSKLELVANEMRSLIIVIYINPEHEDCFARWQLVGHISKYMQDTKIFKFDGKEDQQ